MGHERAISLIPCGLQWYQAISIDIGGSPGNLQYKQYDSHLLVTAISSETEIYIQRANAISQEPYGLTSAQYMNMTLNPATQHNYYVQP